MRSLVETLAAALDSRFIKSLRTDSQFVLRTLCPEYTVSQWLADGGVDREARRLIQTAASKAPFLETLAGELQGDRLAEFSCRGEAALGLGVAVLRAEAALSADRAEWRVDPVSVQAIYLGADGLEEKDEEVSNLYSRACLQRRAGWFEHRARLSIRSGADIIADPDGLFRYLIFTDGARVQLQRLRGNEPEFNAVLQHLSALNHQTEAWHGGPFTTGYPFPCSPESEATLNMYGNLRMFRCPDGVLRQFSWHSKVSIGARRIYFLARHPGEPVMVGYVGAHLPTAAG